ncbi:hypothetical protein [Thermoflexus sp.]|uniref:hypothetical protein n=1 Tax=Thermoflexus sp. TaxID=1969742 RepID=UPI0025E92B20|nr:hypothetical protein [Thermoflexus sp.]MCS6963462.1 hypothetical protein [Thermoflexus sp.]MCX7689950.1 hypothetical protein [Thermoflexus sp.]MDW8184163.1 hypothetical protein [Anaerolineae bacterium]
MFEDIRQHLSEVPEGEAIEESMESRPTVSLFERLAFLQQLTPSQRLILLGLLLADLFLLGLFVFLITGVIRLG